MMRGPEVEVKLDGIVYREFGKRSLDLVAASTALIALSPVLGAVAVLVRVRLGAPVLFRQERPGVNGEPFEMWKFRSMTVQRDSQGQLLPDEVRLTPFGKALRSSSLDELPELLNVIRGDMSLVGPRPLLMEYLPLYSERQRRRHDVRPGLTGLAQVSGRNRLTWDEKFEFDVDYVERLSLRLDLAILWRTLFHVIRRTGISDSLGVTMTPFGGSVRARRS